MKKKEVAKKQAKDKIVRNLIMIGAKKVPKKAEGDTVENY